MYKNENLEKNTFMFLLDLYMHFLQVAIDCVDLVIQAKLKTMARYLSR